MPVRVDTFVIGQPVRVVITIARSAMEIVHSVIRHQIVNSILIVPNVSMDINIHSIIAHKNLYQIARVNSPHVKNASPAHHHQVINTHNASPATTHKHNFSTARQQDALQTAQSHNFTVKNVTQVK